MMKRLTILPALALTAALLAFAACAGGPEAGEEERLSGESPDGFSLDEGIAQIAQAIEAELPAGTRIAVVNFTSPSAYFSDYVLEELQGYLVNNKRLVVTERSSLELLRNELTFQMSGDVSDETAVSIGKFLGTQALVTGGLTDLGGAYRFRFNAIDIETAVRQASPAVTVRRDDAIAFMLPAQAAPPAQIPARPDPALAAAYFNAGMAHYEAGRYAEAAAEFSRVLEVRADDEAALRYRAYSYYYLEDYDRAVTDMSRLIRMQPGNAENYLTRGAAYYKQGDYDRATEDFNKAIRLNPNDAQAYYNRGNACYYKGDIDKAIGDYTEAIRLKPDYAMAYYNRGLAYRNKGGTTTGPVQINYEKALQIDPNHAKARNNLEALRQAGY
jgi:Flp pilus assembly protein TadD